MRRILILSILVSILAVLAVQLSRAPIPQTMSYQGTLTDAGSTPVTDGNYDITFKLYDLETGGAALWTETQSVAVVNSAFNAILGSTAPLTLPFDQQYWLGVTVGTSSELEPRTQLTSAAYSLNSQSAGPHDHGGETWTGNGTGTGLTLENQNIGLSATGVETGITAHSTTGPAIVAVAGESSASLSTGGRSRSSPTDDEDAVGVSAFGYQAGVKGSSISGRGVIGHSATSEGVRGESVKGVGVLGTTTDGAGVLGHSVNGYGVRASGGKGAALFEGDVTVEGEVYAKSFHTKNASDENTSGIDTDGNASFDGEVNARELTVTVPSGRDPIDPVLSIEIEGDSEPTIEFRPDGTIDGAALRLTVPSGWAEPPIKVQYGSGEDPALEIGLDGKISIRGGPDSSPTNPAISIFKPGVTTPTFTTALDGEVTGTSFKAGDVRIGGYGNENQIRVSGVGGDDTILGNNGVDVLGGAGEPSAQIGNDGFTAKDGFGLPVFWANSQGHVDLNSWTVSTDTGGTIEVGPWGIHFYDQHGVMIGWWCIYTGDFWTWGLKLAAVPTTSYGRRGLYVEESAEVYFFDRGEGQLFDGEVTVELEPVFAETVTIDQANPMLVQITPTSDCNGLYVAQRAATSFTVKELGGGQSNAGFMWEVGAKRKGYEDRRLEDASEVMASLAARKK